MTYLRSRDLVASTTLLLHAIIFYLLIATTLQHDISRNFTTKKPSTFNHSANLELTTIKIAEVSSRANTTLILKEFTAKHYTTSTPMSKVILIPPANHSAQIDKRKNSS